MARRILPIILVLAFTVSLAQEADAALYRGGGEGIRIEFRVRGEKIVFAKVRTTLRCTDRDDRLRRLRRFGAAWGADDLSVPGVNEFHTRPIDLLPNGKFDASYDRDSAAEEDFWNEELFLGRVSHGEVSGVFAYEEDYHSPRRSEVCRTAHFQSFGGKVLHFRATRSRSVGRG